ncbi:MAG: chromate transporter [Clostridia bacterium]|nr:chromate transporter [Clostridia bacterium]
MKTLLQLFLIFARIGGFTFGGGYAMLPMLQKELVDNKKWTTNEELIDYYAIGQCTPGIIAVNVATFVGFKTKGVLGGIFATLGMITPSLIIVGSIAAFISGFQDYQVVQWAFSGIRAAVVALILNAMWKIAKKSLVDIFAVIIFLIVAALSFLTDISPVIFVLAAGVCGLIINLSGLRKAKEEKQK